MTHEMQNPPDGAGFAEVHTFGDSVQTNCIADAARALAASGRRIFPLQPNSKHSAVKDWPNVATSDAATVAHWWTQWPGAGIGIATGRGLLVLDVDVKDGAQGTQSLQELQAQHGPLPQTSAVTTTSGGTHFYYACNVPIRNSASRIGAGLDIRGDGGCVVAPPTIINGRAYSWANALPVVPAPDWLVNLAGRSVAPPAPGTHRTILDPTPNQLHDIKSALDFLDPGPRDMWIAVAAALRCLGSLGHVLWRDWSMHSEKWRDGDEQVFLTVGDDRSGLKGLFARAQAAGWINPRSNAARAKGAEPSSSVIVASLSEILMQPFPPRELLLAPWLASQSLTMLHAWRGTGKTHVALGIAHALACGGAFLNWRAVNPVPVLYIDGEMPGPSLKARLAAIVAAAGGKPDDCLLRFVTPDLQPDGLMPDLATVEGQRAIEAELGDARVIVVDNISCLVRSGAKENDAESWGGVAAWALRQRARGRSVVFIHHSGKGGQQRGTSKREDVLDTVIALRRPTDYEPEQGARFEIHFEKGRDLKGQEVNAIEAWLQQDAQGRQVWSIKDASNVMHDRIVEMTELGLGPNDIAQELGCGRATVYRHLKTALENGEVRARKRPILTSRPHRGET